jgi:hypothetical protein
MSEYESDFYTWTQTQAAALRAQEWKTLDIEHLAEEIEDLGQSIENAIESHLERLLLHLLKYRYDPAQRPRRLWRLTIRHARREIAKLIRKNPGLQHHPARYLAEAYQHARDDAPDATDLPLTTFPEACPWPVERVLDLDFWPDAPTSENEDEEIPRGPRGVHDASGEPPAGRGPGRRRGPRRA